MNSDIILDDENFEEYFFDARRFRPKRGQVMACYTAMVDFVDGFEKRQLIDLLQTTDKAVPAANVMKRLCYAVEPDCYRVPREMMGDLLSGMTSDEVAEKKYRFKTEMFYYCDPENVPTDDLHWSCVTLKNLDNFLDAIEKESPSE